MNPALATAAELIGVELNEDMTVRLGSLAAWLRREAVKTGGLGPREGNAIERRHIADSMLFGLGWSQPPTQCWDLGSGAGLPGLVLAVVWPRCRMVLFDRSTRRVDLARRGARVVGIDVDVEVAAIADLQGPVEAVVSRAAMDASALLPHLRRIVAPGGRAVVSGRGEAVSGYEIIAIEDWQRIGFHARPPRLLMMRQP